MTKDTIPCPDCGGTMDVGFLPEVTHNGITGMTCWHPGPPDQQTFLGFKTGAIKVDWKKVAAVFTYRCRKCGALRAYAPAAEGE